MKSGFEIWRCDACGVGWTAIGDDFDPAAIYSEDYFEGGRGDGYADYGSTEKVLRREFRAVLRKLKRVRPRSGKLVEIGSAYGYFLLEAQMYFDSCGIEVSPSAVEHARSIGVQCVQGEVSDALLEQCGPIDVAVMLDVIEHLPSPREVLSKLHAHMRPGGHLVITTGDWGSVYSRLAGRSWRLMTRAAAPVLLYEKEHVRDAAGGRIQGGEPVAPDEAGAGESHLVPVGAADPEQAVYGTRIERRRNTGEFVRFHAGVIAARDDG